MKTTNVCCTFFVLSLLLSSVFMATEARPFNVLEPRSTGLGVFGGLFDGLSLGAIKESGPSDGQGHQFKDSQTLGGIKDGPSPGQGHRSVNGVHHQFKDSETLGGIKDGPSAPGQGHSSVNGVHH